MKTMGIVFLPGAITGMIVAFMLLTAVSLTATLVSLLSRNARVEGGPSVTRGALDRQDRGRNRPRHSHP